MTLALPPNGLPVTNTWIAALTNLHNGILSSAEAAASSPLTVTTSTADVPGASAAFTTAGASAVALVIGTFDVQATSSSAGNVVTGKCQMDAGTASQQAIWQDNGLNSRYTVSQTFLFTGLSAGSHTVKLRASKISAPGTHVVNSGNTTMTVLVLDLL